MGNKKKKQGITFDSVEFAETEDIRTLLGDPSLLFISFEKAIAFCSIDSQNEYGFSIAHIN